MKELMQKAMHFGLGLWDFTKEKAEDVVADLVKRGELSQHETPEAVEKIMASAQEAQQSLAAKVKELTDQAIAEMNLARASDLAALEKRLAALEGKKE
jgi:polyhydroxyalkanoate synthesis regulator phasin